MLTSVDLEFKWLNLERPESSRRTALAGLDVETKYGFLRIGLDSTGARHLMVPAKSGDIADQVLSSGVVVADTRYVVDGQETAFADLVCIKGELHAVFSEFAADLARRFADQKDATEPDEPFEVITACSHGVASSAAPPLRNHDKRLLGYVANSRCYASLKQPGEPT